VTSTGITRLRAVLRAIEVTILVFTMKFQTGGGWWVDEGVDAQKEKGRERERERKRKGVVQGMET